MIEWILLGAAIYAAGTVTGALIVATTAEYIWGDFENASEKDSASDGEN